MKLFTFGKTIFRKSNRFPHSKFILSATTKDVVRLLLGKGPQDISCDDLNSILGEFDNANNRNESILIFMPLLRQHLDKCRELYEAVLIKLQP